MKSIRERVVSIAPSPPKPLFLHHEACWDARLRVLLLLCSCSPHQICVQFSNLSNITIIAIIHYSVVYCIGKSTMSAPEQINLAEQEEPSRFRL